MPSQKNKIIKGYYQYPQISDFVSVKDFMFVSQEGKKCLIIRFSNDSDYRIDSMRFVIVELDPSGSVIGKKKISKEALDLMPGKTYISSSAIVVDDRCADFRIAISEVRSGDYRYRVRNGKNATDRYSRKRRACNKAAQGGNLGELTVKLLRVGNPTLAKAAAVILLLSLLCVNAYQLFSLYYTTELENAAQETTAEVTTVDESEIVLTED